MQHERKEQNASVVLIGSFTPTDFLPGWLAKEKLIRTSEALDAKLLFVHPDTVEYSLSTPDEAGGKLQWMDCMCDKNRLQFRTPQTAYFEVIRDMVHGLLDLRDVAVKYLGLNWEFTLSITDTSERNRLGLKLAPRGPWEGLVNNSVLRHVAIEETVRTDGLPGTLRIEVMAPFLASDDNLVVIKVNNQFELSEPGRSVDVRELISQYWDACAKRSEEAVSFILNL